MQSSFNLPRPASRPCGRHLAGILVPVAMAVLMAACSSSSKEAANALALALSPPSAPRVDEPAAIVRHPEEFSAKGVAGRDVNRDVDGQPLSVVVRVIQLRDKNEFSRLSFDAAASRGDAELFPKEFVTASEWVLMPGTTQDITDKILPETKYVGVIGYFRRPDAQHWRFLFDAHAVRKEGLVVVALDCYFSAVTPKFEPLPGQSASYRPGCAGIIPGRRSRR